MVFDRQTVNAPFGSRAFLLKLALLTWAAFASPFVSHANPYLAKPGEPATTVYVATCAVTGGFIQLYTALDNNLFDKYGIAIKHVVIRGGTNINLAATRRFARSAAASPSVTMP